MSQLQSNISATPRGLPIGNSIELTFTGKERDEETGYSYFGARYYDADLLTGWMSVDPMSDKYPSISPYAYCAWNPVKLVDPDGRDSVYYSLLGAEVHRIKCEKQVKLLAICTSKNKFNKEFSINVAHINLEKMDELFNYSDNNHKECGYQVKRDGTKEDNVYGTNKKLQFPAIPNIEYDVHTHCRHILNDEGKDEGFGCPVPSSLDKDKWSTMESSENYPITDYGKVGIILAFRQVSDSSSGSSFTSRQDNEINYSQLIKMIGFYHSGGNITSPMLYKDFKNIVIKLQKQ